MMENHEHEVVGVETPSVEPVAETVVEAPSSNGSAVAGSPTVTTDWHAEAGRKGAYRIRELIRHGRVYEQEHGLTSGRQRLRQLIEEGKRYEEEHGLRPARRRSSRQRMSKQEALRTFLHSVVRLAKPGLRGELMRLIEAVEKQASAAGS